MHVNSTLHDVVAVGMRAADKTNLVSNVRNKSSNRPRLHMEIEGIKSTREEAWIGRDTTRKLTGRSFSLNGRLRAMRLKQATLKEGSHLCCAFFLSPEQSLCY